MNILVLVRYPLDERSGRVLRRAVEMASAEEDAGLRILHVNLLQADERVTLDDLREAVEADVGTISAEYRVSDAFIIEEVILEEAADESITHVVISERRHSRWKTALLELLDLDVDLESFLRENLHVELVVVP